MSLTTRMTIDPSTEDDKVFKEYPRLKEVCKEEGIDLKLVSPRLLKYISWVYDPNTPLASSHVDLSSRKKEAIRLTKFDGYVDPRIVFIFVSKVINNRLWTEIVSNEMVFEEYTQRVLSPIGDTLDEDKLLKAVQLKNTMLLHMGDMRKRIKTLRSELFAADDSLMEQNKANLRLTAENISTLIDE